MYDRIWWYTVGENLVFIDEKKTSLTLNKRSVSLHNSLVWIDAKEFRKLPEKIKGTCYDSHVQDKSKAACRTCERRSGFGDSPLKI